MFGVGWGTLCSKWYSFLFSSTELNSGAGMLAVISLDLLETGVEGKSGTLLPRGVTVGSNGFYLTKEELFHCKVKAAVAICFDCWLLEWLLPGLWSVAQLLLVTWLRSSQWGCKGLLVDVCRWKMNRTEISVSVFCFFTSFCIVQDFQFSEKLEEANFHKLWVNQVIKSITCFTQYK